MKPYLAILLLLLIGSRGVQGQDAQSQAEEVVRLPVMTWYHPVLEPGVSDILLLCTVSAVAPATQVYGNEYWTVTLRIDERIHIAERYRKRLEGVRLIESGDFRQRAVGERIILFAGGETYEGYDFALPCWSGTGTDLGILLHPKDHFHEEKNAELLGHLRQATAGKVEETAFFKAFAEYCPKGVAHHLIRRLEMEEARREGEKDSQ